MSWGRNDQAVTLSGDPALPETSNGAPIGTSALVKAGGEVASVRPDGANAHYGDGSVGSRANVDSQMFNNTTVGAFIPGMAVGVFGVTPTEAGVATGNIVATYVTFAGSGYDANAVVTLTYANGVTNVTSVNAFANVSAGNTGGKITSLPVGSGGPATAVAPTVSVAAPALINVAANTTKFILPTANNINPNTQGVVSSAILITTANTLWSVGDRVYYGVPTNNTAITGLTANSYYYISFANSTAVKLANSLGGANLTLTGNGTSSETHTLRGDGSFINIASASSRLQVGDRFTYGVPTNNTAVAGLTANTVYFIKTTNSTGVTLSATLGGNTIKWGTTQVPAAAGEYHSLKGETATGYVTIGGGKNKGVAHAGWVVRREGTGGRAGRVHYETLVAMGSLGQTDGKYGTPAGTADASDDAVLPDA